MATNLHNGTDRHPRPARHNPLRLLSLQRTKSLPGTEKDDEDQGAPIKDIPLRREKPAFRVTSLGKTVRAANPEEFSWLSLKKERHKRRTKSQEGGGHRDTGYYYRSGDFPNFEEDLELTYHDFLREVGGESDRVQEILRKVDFVDEVEVAPFPAAYRESICSLLEPETVEKPQSRDLKSNPPQTPPQMAPDRTDSLQDHGYGKEDFRQARSSSAQHSLHADRSRVMSPDRSPTPSPQASQASRSGSPDSYQTDATSLPALQQKSYEEGQMEPLGEDELDPSSFELVTAAAPNSRQYSLERRSEQMFSAEHLRIIFADPSLLMTFSHFLSMHRKSSVPLLIYYLDAIKALKAIKYSNAIAEALDPIHGFDFTDVTAPPTKNQELEVKARAAFDVLVREELPAFITHTYIQTVSLSIQRRISGTLPAHLREASEGLAEVFVLTDPSRADNPIVFSSEEFYRTTQYGMSYVLGRNCRFLQGPKTNPFSVRRLREKIQAGVEHCEVFLNYRRDGSPFMNLLMCAPLCDSRGTIRYFIGAQVDVSGLVKECSDLESLQTLVNSADAEPPQNHSSNEDSVLGNPLAKPAGTKDEFQELSEMLNLQELDTVRRHGGRMHKESYEETSDTNFANGNWNKPRLLIQSTTPDGNESAPRVSGRLSGIYENYLLVRPYPNLRILFTSPSLRFPGILQSPFMNKIGGSSRVREELTAALADGRGVTAKVRWISKTDPEGRPRWIHCTPLLGSNGAVGVWMVVIVDDETTSGKRFRKAPPVDPRYGRAIPFSTPNDAVQKDFARPPTAKSSSTGAGTGGQRDTLGVSGGSLRSFDAEATGSRSVNGSVYTLRLD